MMMMAGIENQKRRHKDCCFPTSRSTASTRAADYGTTTTTMASKKPKSLSQKEKKDRIGERVAALQQLVSPFGKSDTASVLQEASAYIKFLHEQLQVLSAPYLRIPPSPPMADAEHCYSLRCHGLCLVPVSSAAGIRRSNGADLWAPVNYQYTGKHS